MEATAGNLFITRLHIDMSHHPPRPCPVCLSVGERYNLHRQQFYQGPLGNGYQVSICGACGAGFSDDIPSQETLDRYYAERSKYTYTHQGGAESSYDLKRFELIADQFTLHLPSKSARILDIGCATGGLLSVLARRGYSRVSGSDPAPQSAQIARRLYGIEVKTLTLAEHVGLGEQFDAILLVGVLEHLRDLHASLQIVVSLLAPGGIIYCAQPDVEGFAECKNAPYQQFSTEHVNFFSVSSLNNSMLFHGLGPLQFWRWHVEWREDVTDSVLSAVYSRIKIDAGLHYDRETKRALSDYISIEQGKDQAIVQRIKDLVKAGDPILVWGTGTLTLRLLATTELSKAHIIGFIDSNPAAGTELAGRRIFSPQSFPSENAAILVCSLAFKHEIIRTIRSELHLENSIIELL